jgi:chromosome partitioning protein
VTTIAFLGEKGGAGKSTLAVNVAAELAARGRRVLLVDADPQGTAITWASIAVEAGDAPTTIALGDNLRAALPAASAGFTDTVIDLPGRASKRAVGALMLSDVAVIPCGPSPADAWALAPTVELVGEARSVRAELRAVLVLNRADRTSIGASTREAIAGLGLPVLEASIGDRVAFREALAAGQGVTTYASASPAAGEVRELVHELEALTRAGRRRKGA